MIPNILMPLKPALRSFRDKVHNVTRKVPKRAPDFIIIGATRCGTTYLYHMLKSHPDVFMPEKKELHYFNHDGRYNKTLDNYKNMFHGYEQQPLIGEATPMYMEKGRMYNADGTSNFFHHDSAIARIHEHMPDAKLIVSLRDPVSRLLSMYKKSYGQGKVDKSLKTLIQEEFTDQAKYFFINRSRYDLHFENIFRYFPKESLKIVVFEEWTKQPEQTYLGLCDFIGATKPLTTDNLTDQGKNNIEKYQKRSVDDYEEKAHIDDELEQLIKEKLSPVKPYVEDLLGREMPWS